MTKLNDHELLADFARNESEFAFAELVARHVNLVYSTALRFAGNPHHAEEITQAVFIILARKAENLSPRVVLSGWLYQTTRLTAANFMKGEIRRQNREQEAYMQSTLNETDPAAWEQIAPLLDDAIGGLGETDRNAVVLRFFENKTAAEIAVALKTSEAAAHKRVNRALEKLRKIFTKRGVTLTAAIIAGAVSTNSVQSAPAGLVATVSATVAKSVTISTTITTLVKGTMKTMTWLKFKFAASMTVVALLVGGAATVAVSQQIGKSGNGLTPLEIAKQVQEAYAALSSYSDSGTVRVEGTGHIVLTKFDTRLQRPNFYRVDWTQTSGTVPVSKGSVWSAGKGDFMQMSVGGREIDATPQKRRDMQINLGAAAGVSSSASSTVPAAFFAAHWGDVLSLALAQSPAMTLTKEPDAEIGGVDCHAFTGILDSSKLPGGGKLPNGAGTVGKTATTFWIGKQDHLIHQVRQTIDTSSISMPAMSDETIKAALERLKKPATPAAIAAVRTQMPTAIKKILASKLVFTQTHDNIVVNQKFSPADFVR